MAQLTTANAKLEDFNSGWQIAYKNVTASATTTTADLAKSAARAVLPARVVSSFRLLPPDTRYPRQEAAEKRQQDSVIGRVQFFFIHYTLDA